MLKYGQIEIDATCALFEGQCQHNLAEIQSLISNVLIYLQQYADIYY